jgi:hypothetical protein
MILSIPENFTSKQRGDALEWFEWYRDTFPQRAHRLLRRYNHV